MVRSILQTCEVHRLRDLIELRFAFSDNLDMASARCPRQDGAKQNTSKGDER
jgi:hypothetical protein